MVSDNLVNSPASTFSLTKSVLFEMCTRRHVCYIYTKCGHAYTMPEESVPCDNPRCKFSPVHPKNCAQCKQTCWQYRQPTEQYSPHLNEHCPNCARR